MMMKLTKNQKLVLEILMKAKAPLSAYDILELLRPEGLRAPAQIYRALEKLLETETVHRIESLNAFVACRHHGEAPTCGPHAFTICTNCNKVVEVDGSALTPRLEEIAQAQQFTIDQATIEIRGLCNACQSQR